MFWGFALLALRTCDASFFFYISQTKSFKRKKKRLFDNENKWLVLNFKSFKISLGSIRKTSDPHVLRTELLASSY